MNQPANVKAVTAMVTGILSIILFLLPLLGIALALAGIYLGITSLKEIKQTGEKGKGYALTGIWCGIIGLLIPAALAILAVWMFLL